MNRVLILSLCLASVACGDDDGRDVDAGDLADGGVDGGADSAPDAGPTSVAPGAACDCDSECEGTTENPGLCVQGICMMRATAMCASAGSSEGCPAGSRCWGLTDVEGGICWPDCDAHTCAGACDSDGSCIADDTSTCMESCSEVCSEGATDDCPAHSHMGTEGCVCDEGFVVNAERTACIAPCTMDEECSGEQVCRDGVCRAPPCTADSCDAGLICAESGDCVIDLGTPPPGPVPTCAAGMGDVPDWRCTSDCGTLVSFDPRAGYGYEDYPLNGETAANQYRSYVRRDVANLIAYAAGMVACQTGAWTAGNGGDLMLGDMSEADGAIPGTSVGSPGHPAGTHVNGHDLDIGYYQTGTADNRLRPVCDHMSGGADQYHCVGAPTLLDPWRTALFIGHLHVSPQLRVIGVDGKVGPLVESAMTQLCAEGWLTTGCSSRSVTYEETDMGRGWYAFHHHHLHVSVSSP